MCRMVLRVGRNVSILILTLSFFTSYSQVDSLKKDYNGIKFNTGQGELKLSFLNQIWVRYGQNNPGTAIDGKEVNDHFDIGLRRTRLVLSGSPYKNTYVFVQWGMNNFNYLTSRKSDFFIHDASFDYKIIQSLGIGAGLTGWGGFSRMSSPSVGNIMGVDAPLFLQSTNDATDQFLRKLSVYAKGEINKFHYRVAVSKPLLFQNSSQYSGSISQTSTFANTDPSPQLHGYFKYDFWEKESHSNPYTKGTYLGSKKVLNVGVGFLYQSNAMTKLSATNDTVYSDLKLASFDLFCEYPMKNNAAINVYGGYYFMDFGNDYLRNIGAMNVAKSNLKSNIVNGAGVAYPMIGTGSTLYLQTGYLLPVFNEGNNNRIMLYGAYMYGNFEALDEQVNYYDLGVNYYINKQRLKVTLAHQNRPVFETNLSNQNMLLERKGLWIVQVQTVF